MTLDQLRYFQAVCKYDGVNRAAEVLNISQPSVSNAIANLEQEFSVELFTRQRKRLLLTEEGRIMSELAEKLLLQADETSRTMRELGNHNKVLRLGVPPMIGSLVLPILYGEHFKRYPQLQVRIFEDDGSGLKRLLAENQIDMAFLPHTHPFGGDLCAQPLTELQNVCCVHKTHRLAAQNSVRLEELRDEPLVLFKNSFFQTERIMNRFSKLCIIPNVLLDTAQLPIVQNMIASKMAVGFMFEFLTRATPDLVGIPLDPPMTTQVSLVWKRSSYISADMKNLIEFIKSVPNLKMSLSACQQNDIQTSKENTR